MRFIWTLEPNDAVVLRCPKRAARVHVGRREDGTGYVATILEPGMPSCGPFKERYKACLWAQDYVKRKLFPDAEFGDVPRYVFDNSAAVKKRRAKVPA